MQREETCVQRDKNTINCSFKNDFDIFSVDS